MHWLTDFTAWGKEKQEIYMNIKPLADRIVLEQLEAEEKTKSGIILVNDKKGKSPYYLVSAIGDDVVGIAIGDKVLINKYSGANVKLDEKEYIIIKQSDIVAVVGEV